MNFVDVDVIFHLSAGGKSQISHFSSAVVLQQEIKTQDFRKRQAYVCVFAYILFTLIDFQNFDPFIKLEIVDTSYPYIYIYIYMDSLYPQFQV